MAEPSSFEELDIAIRNVIDAETTKFLELANLLGLDIKQDFVGADLSGVDLSGCDLSFANFAGTNLRGANLSSANLQDAILTNADLSFANLSSVVNIDSVQGFSEACFEKTIMIGCQGLLPEYVTQLAKQGAILEAEEVNLPSDEVPENHTSVQRALLSLGEQDSSVDNYLQKLATEAQSSALNSRERRRALSNLLRTLERSKQLARPRRGQFQGFYDDIYAEAVQRLFVYVCERIDQYDSSKGTVLQWVNFLLSRRFFIEASREILPTVPKGLDARTTIKIDVSELDQLFIELNQSSDSLFLIENPLAYLEDDLLAYLKDDPNQILRTTHITNHPEANFQYLALKQLEGSSWQELSNKLNIPIPTLTTFYQRCIENLTSIIMQDLS